MKIRTPAQIVDSSNKTPQDVLRHVQNITDDVRQILKGGLSMSDAQLPFQQVSVFVTNNVPAVLYIQSPYSIIGCIPIQTNGVIINSFQTNINNGIFTVTLSMNVQTANIVFLTVGTNT